MCTSANIAPAIIGEPGPDMRLWSTGVAILLALVALSVTTAQDLERPANRNPAPAGAEPAVLETYRSLSLRPSHNGLFQAVVVDVVEDSERGVAAEWIVRVTDSGGIPVADARIDTNLWMPESGERSGAVLQTGSHRGDGEYAIRELDFPRAGWWNVALRISAGIGTDSLAFNVVLPAAPGVSPRGILR
jgi:hypothetical protein